MFALKTDNFNRQKKHYRRHKKKISAKMMKRELALFIKYKDNRVSSASSNFEKEHIRIFN